MVVGSNPTSGAMSLIDYIFLVFAIFFSFFYGCCGWFLWFNQDSRPKLRKSRIFHEMWFNFAGSLIGWICIFATYKSLASLGWQDVVGNIRWQHIALFIIGTLGITGLLPYVLWGISRSVDSFIAKLLGRQN